MKNQRYTAFDKGFKQGIQACRNGLKSGDCPFDRDSLEALGWQTGLEEGAVQEQVIVADRLGWEAAQDSELTLSGAASPCPFFTSRLKAHWISGWIRGAALDEPGLYCD